MRASIGWECIGLEGSEATGGGVGKPMRLGNGGGRILIVAAMVALAGANGTVVASAATCTRDDFANVVEQASDTLRTLNADNTPKFQAKLRALKDRRKWSHDQFMKEAAPFVQDDKIQVLDEQTATLLNKIQGLGEGGGGREPDCALLAILQTHMHALVETTQAKWSYMNTKIDAALTAAN